MKNVSEFEAIKKWNSIPKDFRQELLKNVFCMKCRLTSLAPNYTITYKEHTGILLTGTCSKCGGDVCRVVETE